ncbi:MAG: ACP S-malonyltransferase [Deltaproteobacteria bacterium]|nr:ACP S-malonyltransferase [Deltaproteobacteria bacterium]MBW1718459.1 ACP S-malonyltransferase [Deltaproteobacteria bacterium]MBW1931644.1 ACP S-malonyltransferase [Deltaproteobacteria bacterium]MBW1937664.1 ACP S-malonyltransferase [Deltaproteobacteria bacterium]MBW1964542.1 ACP S-malonyltransferase [Deltaproteobacteria bacterium]
MKSNLAFVFPGQGSQYVGMGKALLETVSDAAYVFSVAEELTGLPLKKLCIEGPMEELTQVENLQPCLTAVEVICCMAARNNGLKAAAVAGHSLGEYPALWAAEIISLEDTFKLVHTRGCLMKEVGDKNPGAMAAVIGLSRKELEELIAPLAKKGILVLANHNSPEQIVFTGETGLIDDLCEEAKTRGARAIPLKVSGAYHSPLMDEASKRFSEILDKISFYKPRIPIYSNVTAKPESDPEKIKDLMKKQICSPVRWYEIVINMDQDGISNFIELGPKKVLSNLIRKCLSEGSASVFQGENPENIEACFREIKSK